MRYIGIDLGGTNIKAAVVNSEGEILSSADRKTALPRSGEEVCADIALTCADAAEAAGLPLTAIDGFGMGSPGAIDAANGVVIYANNLGWKDFRVADELEKLLPKRPEIANDADAAAFGELTFGAAKGVSDAVIITLGTGVGTGVIVNGRILSGLGGAGEVGHMVIDPRGPLCTCGRVGCFEAFSSATGLIRMTREAVEAHPSSGLAALVGLKGYISARHAFEAARKGDETGLAVVEEYLDYLSIGVANIVNIFRPAFVGLAGGVSNESDEWLLLPLIERVKKANYGGLPMPKIGHGVLGAKAGLVGAASLAVKR